MGLSVDEGIGPRFHQPLRAPADFDRLRDPVPERDLGYVLDALRLTRRALGGGYRSSGSRAHRGRS